MEGLNRGVPDEKLGRDKVKDSDMVRYSNWRIAREILEVEYSWDSEGARKAEIVNNGNIVQ